jgi:hypothetical protein
MSQPRSGLACGAVLLSTLLPAPPVSRALAQDVSRPHKSVYGTLELVNEPKSGIIMKTDEGERMAWRFDAKVVAEVAKVKSGERIIVIYRQTSSNEKRVTAIAFPGTAEKATYLNMTRESIGFRTAPSIKGECTPPGEPVTESTIPAGGRAETTEGCWCCARPGEACTPGNKTGLGKALLTACFI